MKNCLIDNCQELITNEALVKSEVPSDWFSSNDKLNFVSRVGLLELFKSNDVKKKPDFRLK